MNKKTLFGLSAIVIASIFTACDLTYFDNDIEDFVWDGGVKAPLGFATYTLSELFDELQVENILEESNGNLYVEYSKTISEGNTDAFDVQIPNETIGPKSIPTPITASQFTAIGGSPYTIPSGSPFITDVPVGDQIQKTLTISQNLTAATFSNGNLILNFDSSFDSSIEVTVTIPSLLNKTDDSEFSQIYSLPIDNGDHTINLSSYKADFTNDGTASDETVNNFVVNIDAIFKFREGNQLDQSDEINYSATLADATTEVVYGDFLQEDFETETTDNIIDLDFFDDFGTGAITFTDASLTIAATSGYGFPIGIDLSGIEGDNGDGSPIKLSYDGTTADEIALGNDTFIINALPTYSLTGALATPEITLDKTNSNINELLSSKPTTFSLGVSGSVNPIDLSPLANTNFYGTVNTALSLDIAVKVPLNIKFEGVTIEQDEVEFDLGQDIDEINNIGLGLTTVNTIPLSGSISIIFLKDGIDLNITKTIAGFDAAPVDDNGSSNGTATKTSDLDFTTEELQELKEATHIKLTITFNSPPEEDSVNLIGSNSIKAILTADAEVEISTADEDNE
jgi:hypothetical protein